MADKVFSGFYGHAGVRLGPPTVVDVPYVEGAGTVGETLTSTMGNWTGEPDSYAYQWQRNATEDIGTGDTYRIVAADAGHSITCVVTATNAAGSTEAPPSNAVVVAAAVRSTHSSQRK
jgi:hypothetical protein